VTSRILYQTVRAVYKNGTLRLLDLVAWREGEQVAISILPERELVRLALADILVHFDPEPGDDEEIDEAALQAEIDAELQGQSPMSELIIQERREGP
jgi:predicted DNA-binding antitoxin AbrB/MazE fold protein